MIRNILFALIIASLSAQTALAQAWATKMFNATQHDFGSVARGAKTEFAFEIKNIYKEDVHIAGVRSSCGCTTPRITKSLLKTWETGQIVCTFNTRSFLRDKNATVTVTFDKPYYAEVQLSVAGYVRTDVVLHPGVVKFGSVDHGESSEQKIAITYAGRNDWRLVDVRSANSNLEIELVETQRGRGRVAYEMLVRLKEDADVGYINDQVTLVTNDHRYTHIPLYVEGRVVSAITVSPGSLSMGVVKPGQKVTKRLVVRGKEPFKIVRVKCAEDCFQFDTTDEAKTIHIIPVTFTASDAVGNIVQTIEIETDLGDGTVTTCLATAIVKTAAEED